MDICNSKGETILTIATNCLLGYDFSEMDLQDACFAGLIMEGAHFEYSNLLRANFAGTELYWGTFFHANVSYCNFENANLQGADFKHANMQFANLKDALLGQDNLGGSSNLMAANLDQANLEGTNLKGAYYDDLTTFPSGFDPLRVGMIHRELQNDS